MYSGISETVVERKPDSIAYLNSAGFPVFFLDVDHTEKSCLSLSDIKKVLETPDMIVICLRGNLILPVKKTGFIQGDVEHCVKYLRSQIGSR